MAVDLELSPKRKRPKGEPCCEPVVYPDVEREQRRAHGRVAKALGDPIRLQLVDVLRKHAGKVCVCELVPLFDLSQPTRLPPPQGPARGRHRRLRAARAVGLLLRHRRITEGVERMAELTTTRTRSARPCASATRPRRAASAPRAPAAAATRRAPAAAPAKRRRPRTRSSAPRSTTSASASRCPTRRGSPRSAAATRPRSPSCARARRCSTSARAAASTCCSRRAASARPGKAYGLDMTDEMLELARANQRQAGVENVEFLKRHDRGRPAPRRLRRRDHLQLRDQPLRPTSPRCFAEAARVLRPGGRFAVSDVVADADMDEATRADIAAVDRLHRRRADPRTSSGTRSPTPGFDEIEIAETHRVHEQRRLGDRPRAPAARPRGQVVSQR